MAGCNIVRSDEISDIVEEILGLGGEESVGTISKSKIQKKLKFKKG